MEKEKRIEELRTQITEVRTRAIYECGYVEINTSRSDERTIDCRRRDVA